MKINMDLSNYCMSYDLKKNHLRKRDALKLNTLIQSYFNKVDSCSSSSTNLNHVSLSESHIVFRFNNHEQTLKVSKTHQLFLKKIFKDQPSLEISRDPLGQMIKTLYKNEYSYYYLYSSGGNGHKSAKDALLEKNLLDLLEKVKIRLIQNQTIEIDPSIQEEDFSAMQEDLRLLDPSKFIDWCKNNDLIREDDVLKGFLGKVGSWCADQWDHAQQSGDAKKQKSLASKQWLSDLFFGPIIFIKTLKSLVELKPEKIVCTQALANYAILLAIRVYNRFFLAKNSEPLKLHLYMTDMATKYSEHFFNSIKMLPSALKKNLILYAPVPYKHTDWQELCHLPQTQVKALKVSQLPVRPAFITAIENFKPNFEHPHVLLNISCEDELSLLDTLLKHQTSHGVEASSHITVEKHPQNSIQLKYHMNSEDENLFIMLGSQPTESEIQKHIDDLISKASSQPDKVYHTFVFAGPFDDKRDCFYKRLHQFLLSKKTWPSNLKILPLSFQDQLQIVSLYLMCDTVTHSGGLTSMELLVIQKVLKKYPHVKRKRLIHVLSLKDRKPENCMPLWEKGNFHVLQKKIGAELLVLTP